MPSPTLHQVWQHAVTRELWAVRLELDTLTGAYGPVASVLSPEALADLPYEEHPDDLEWFVRASEDFRIMRAAA